MSPTRVVARAVALASLAACFGCGSTSGGVSLPFLSGEAKAKGNEIDSVLAGVDVQWETQPTPTEKAALEGALHTEAERRGYRLGVAESKSHWVLTRHALAGEVLAAGDPAPTRDGYPAALADRVRRLSPRSIQPTGASLELVVQKFDFAVWTGRARFDLDELKPEAAEGVALRALLAQMPRFGHFTPTFTRIPHDSIVSFYTTQLEGKSFFCPVLPYPVHFPDLELEYHRGGNSPKWEDTVNSQTIEDPSLLRACVDLIEHADFALPKELPGYVDAAAPEIWRDVTIFDVYKDVSGAEVPLQLHVRGDTRGYHVADERLLSAAEVTSRAVVAKRFADDVAQVFEGGGR